MGNLFILVENARVEKPETLFGSLRPTDNLYANIEGMLIENETIKKDSVQAIIDARKFHRDWQGRITAKQVREFESEMHSLGGHEIFVREETSGQNKIYVPDYEHLLKVIYLPI